MQIEIGAQAINDLLNKAVGVIVDADEMFKSIGLGEAIPHTGVDAEVFRALRGKRLGIIDENLPNIHASAMLAALAYSGPHNKIRAIKMVREITGCELVEAKSAIEHAEHMIAHLGAHVQLEALTNAGTIVRPR